MNSYKLKCCYFQRCGQHGYFLGKKKQIGVWKFDWAPLRAKNRKETKKTWKMNKNNKKWQKKLDCEFDQWPDDSVQWCNLPKPT